MKTTLNKREFELCKANLHRLNMGHYHAFYATYKKPSEEKIRVFERIIKELLSDDHIYIYKMGVTAYNTMTFTFSCLYFNKFTGESRVRVYTKNNTYDISATVTYEEFKKLYKGV